MKTAVILPAYNEEITIVGTIEGFHQAMPDAEIWVIDNNSKDKTSALANATLRELGCAGGVLVERRQGKANAVRKAFAMIDADVYLMADADMTYPPEQAAELIAPILDGSAEMVVGDRLSQGDYDEENSRPLHGFGNKLMRALINVFFNAKLTDILSGYRAFSKRFVKTYPMLIEGFELETDLTLHSLVHRLSIVEVPVRYKDRPENSFSKLSTFWDGTAVLFFLLQIIRYHRPLLFFGTAGSTLAILGLVTSIPVLQDWFKYQYIHHVPLAVLSAAIEICAIIVLLVGVMLDSISHFNKHRFELLLLAHEKKPTYTKPEEK
ncbi:MAG: glycosyltransferase [SAR324 cluster bacterium]|nr:glycosyltransferase [SAR324 cluster bacterium]